MTATNLSPVQKLCRLKAIEKSLETALPDEKLHAALWQERAAIFATIGAPPLELIGKADSHAWARAFVETFPGFDRETAQLWLVNIMLAGHSAGFAEGRADGYAVGRGEAAELLGVPELVSALQLVRAGLKAGQIKAPQLLDPSRPDARPRALVERVVEALTAAGAA